MTPLPALKAADVIRALKKAGFDVTRIKGSHYVLRHRIDPRRGTVVPVHAGERHQAGPAAEDHQRCRANAR
jgi:predicted RNA binding protein YcfA (HicA-like mRNA interferase family)